MELWQTWVIMKGPNEGRSSSHVHGLPTSPVKVIQADMVGSMLGQIADCIERRDPRELKAMAVAIRAHERYLNG